MNMKKMKKFFTLSRRAEGFTLVELIVVIAILAILGGVAVPAYGGYVKKANMQADISLASEVADALTLYYYSHPNEATSGYVVLSTEGADSDGVIGESAMQAVFGGSWQKAATLKYDGWNGVATGDNISAIGSSSFNQNNLPSLLDKVNVLTGVAADFIGIKGVSPTWLENYANEKGFTDASDTELANLLPMYVADSLSNNLSGTNESGTSKQNDFINYYNQTLYNGSLADKLNQEMGMDIYTAYAVEYAQVEGMLQYYANNGSEASKANAQVLLADWKEKTAGLQEDYTGSGGAAMVETLLADMKGSIVSSLQNNQLDMDAFDAYNAANDANAFCGYMEGLSGASSALLGDADALKDPNLYGNGNIGNLITNYLAASQKLMELGISGSAGLVIIDETGSVMILLSE